MDPNVKSNPLAFRAAFDRVASGWRIAGVAAGIQIEDQPVIERVSGLRRLGTPDLVREGDLWHIGSITKGFTAVIAMRLHERGVLDIDAPLAELLPKYAQEMLPHWRAVTLAQLLGHGAKAPANLKWQKWHPFEGSIRIPRLAAAREIWRVPPIGSEIYSNAGFVLAGCILEELTERRWERLIEREISQPLGLHSIGQGAPQSPAPWGHRGTMWRQPVPPSDLWSDNANVLGPAGRLHMTIPDLLAWGVEHLRMLRGDSALLTQASAQRLHTANARGFGMGWVIDDDLGGLGTPVHFHAGSNTMWHAHLAILPQRDTALALCFNTGAVWRSERAFFNLLAATVLGA